MKFKTFPLKKLMIPSGTCPGEARLKRRTKVLVMMWSDYKIKQQTSTSDWSINRGSFNYFKTKNPLG